jgi:hypothetical protein
MLYGIIATGIVWIYFCVNRHLDKFLCNMFLFIQSAVLLCIFLIVSSMRLFTYTLYFIPVLPLLLISIFLVISKIIKSLSLPHNINNIIFITICACLAYGGIKLSAHEANRFYSYQALTQYKIFSYIKTTIPDGATIIHDHCIGIPEDKKIRSYHYWQHPNDLLITLDADYIIFNPEFKINDKYIEGTLALRQNIQRNHYKKIKAIDDVEIWQKIKK